MRANRLLLFLGFAFLAFEVNGLLTSTTHWSLEKLVKFRRMKKIMEKILENPEASKLLSSVQTGWVQQKLDNFNPANPQYFYQRYYVSTLYWNSSTGPVFVYVGGEDELVPGYLAGGKTIRWFSLSSKEMNSL